MSAFHRPASLLTLLLILLSSFPGTGSGTGPTISARAQDPEYVWVLVRTEVNPTDAKTAFFGGGQDPEWFGEARFKGKSRTFSASDGSFSIHDVEVDHEFMYHDVTMSVNYTSPPSRIESEQELQLQASASGSGTVNEDGSGIGLIFQYSYNGNLINPALSYAPWNPNGTGDSSASWTFTAPTAAEGREFTLAATLWNAAPCLVVWTYRAQPAGSQDTTEENQEQGDEAWTWSDPAYGVDECHEYQQYTERRFNMEAPYVGITVAAMGDVRARSCDGFVSEVTKGRMIALGDCVQTGPDGRARVQMADRDEKRNAGPSVINIARNSEMCFSVFMNVSENKTYKTYYELLKGTIRHFFRGWRGDSQVSVRTGVTVCGARGTDFVVTYDPASQISETFVQEGIVDVTNLETGETKTVNEGQMIITAGNIASAVEPFGPGQWNKFVQDYGIAESSSDPAYYAENIEEDDLPADGINETEDTSSDGEEVSGQYWPYAVIGCLVCGGGLAAASAAVGVWVYSRKKKRKLGGEKE